MLASTRNFVMMPFACALFCHVTSRTKECTASNSCNSQPQRVGDDRHGTERHRSGGENRRKKQTENWIKHARRDWHSGGIIDKGKEQILPDVAHGRLGQ